MGIPRDKLWPATVDPVAFWDLKLNAPAHSWPLKRWAPNISHKVQYLRPYQKWRLLSISPTKLFSVTKDFPGKQTITKAALPFEISSSMQNSKRPWISWRNSVSYFPQSSPPINCFHRFDENSLSKQQLLSSESQFRLWTVSVCN